MFLTCVLQPPNPVSPSSMSSSSVSPFNSMSFPSLFLINTLSHSDWLHNSHQIVVLWFQFAWTCLPRSLLLPSKSWLAAVERHSLLSSICNLVDCPNFHGLVLDWARLRLMAASRTDQAHTHDLFVCAPLFPSSSLFMMYASSFPMNKSLPASVMWDADTTSLVTPATCHVLLRTNPSGVLTFNPFPFLGPLCFLQWISPGACSSASPSPLPSSRLQR